MTRKAVPEATKRAVFMRSHGRCEYLTCDKVCARVGESGEVTVTGELAHINPVGDGPRSEYRGVSSVYIDGPKNVLLLCREHHRLVDHEKVHDHPPELLYLMASRRSRGLEAQIDEFLASSPFNFGHDELVADTRIGRVFTLINDFIMLGPREGMKHLRSARALVFEIESNPHISVPGEVIGLLSLELSTIAASAAFNAEIWRRELKYCQRVFLNIEDPKKIATATVKLMIFARDEHQLFDDAIRLGLIKTIIDRIELKLITEKNDSLLSFSLGIKAELLRWRGWIERDKLSEATYRESERCAFKSTAIAWSAYGQLQLGLTQFARARALPGIKISEYSKEIIKIDETLLDPRLDSFGASIKYRPRYFRDTYRWQAAIESFWLAVNSGFRCEMEAVAYVSGEAIASHFDGNPDTLAHLDRLNSFLSDAIKRGFDHGRNILSWL